MKKKVGDTIITKSVLELTLDERFEKFGREVDKRARGYRHEFRTCHPELVSGSYFHRC